MKKPKSKIHKIRTFALLLVFVGFIIMYAGLLFRNQPILMSILMMLGLLSCVASAIIYFLIGMLSVKAVKVVCPGCNKVTKMLGRVDICMYCEEALTLDKSLEGLEFDKAYNRKKNI